MTHNKALCFMSEFDFNHTLIEMVGCTYNDDVSRNNLHFYEVLVFYLVHNIAFGLWLINN